MLTMKSAVVYVRVLPSQLVLLPDIWSASHLNVRLIFSGGGGVSGGFFLLSAACREAMQAMVASLSVEEENIKALEDALQVDFVPSQYLPSLIFLSSWSKRALPQRGGCLLPPDLAAPWPDGKFPLPPKTLSPCLSCRGWRVAAGRPKGTQQGHRKRDGVGTTGHIVRSARLARSCV